MADGGRGSRRSGRTFSSVAGISRHSLDIVQHVAMFSMFSSFASWLQSRRRRVVDSGETSYEAPAPASFTHVSALCLRGQPAPPASLARLAVPPSPLGAARAPSPLLPCTQLRSMGHAAADFAADYYEALLSGHLPVMSQAQPGFLRRALPAAAPDQADSGEAVLRDIKCAGRHGLESGSGWLVDGLRLSFAYCRLHRLLIA